MFTAQQYGETLGMGSAMNCLPLIELITAHSIMSKSIGNLYSNENAEPKLSRVIN